MTILPLNCKKFLQIERNTEKSINSIESNEKPSSRKFTVKYKNSKKLGKTSVTIKGLEAGKKAWVQVQPLRKAGKATYAGVTMRAKKAVKVKGKAKSVKAQSTGALAAATL